LCGDQQIEPDLSDLKRGGTDRGGAWRGQVENKEDVGCRKDENKEKGKVPNC
jgi:hypothetical protein